MFLSLADRHDHELAQHRDGCRCLSSRSLMMSRPVTARDRDKVVKGKAGQLLIVLLIPAVTLLDERTSFPCNIIVLLLSAGA